MPNPLRSSHPAVSGTTGDTRAEDDLIEGDRCRNCRSGYSSRGEVMGDSEVELDRRLGIAMLRRPREGEVDEEGDVLRSMEGRPQPDALVTIPCSAISALSRSRSRMSSSSSSVER